MKVLVKIWGNFYNNLDMEILKESLEKLGYSVLVSSFDSKIEKEKFKKFDFIFYSYNVRFIIPFLLSKNSYVDIRTYPISKNLIYRYLIILSIRIIHWIKPSKIIFQDEMVKHRIIGSKKHTLYSRMGLDKRWESTSFEKIKINNNFTNVVYHGSLLNRNFYKFFELLNPLKHKRFKFHFISDHKEEFNRIFDKYGDLFHLELHQTVPRSYLPKLLVKFDVGLSWIDTCSIYNYQMPTKVYDFLSLGIPCYSNKTKATNHFMKNDSNIIWYDEYLPNFDPNFNINIKKYPVMQDEWKNVLMQLNHG